MRGLSSHRGLPCQRLPNDAVRVSGAERRAPDQSAESTLAGLAIEAGLAGLAGLAGVATDAGLSGDTGLMGDATLSTERGEAAVFAEAGEGVAGEVVDAGETMLSLVTLKSRSPVPVLSSVTSTMPGTERPVAFSMSGMALATLAAPPAMTPRLSADAAPTAIQFLLSMVMILLLRETEIPHRKSNSRQPA